MARPSPVKRKEKRTEVGDVIEASVNKVADTINKGTGNLIGGLAEKVILGGREATGTHKFSQTYQGRKRKARAGIKGIASNMEY